MTITKTPSEQADEIVGMFKSVPISKDWRADLTKNAKIELAILHVTGIIEVLERLVKDSLLPSAALIKELDEQRSLLTILKEKL